MFCGCHAFGTSTKLGQLLSYQSYHTLSNWCQCNICAYPLVKPISNLELFMQVNLNKDSSSSTLTVFTCLTSEKGSTTSTPQTVCSLFKTTFN